MRTAVQEERRPATRSGGSAVTSAAVLLLVLAPAFIVITTAEALPHGPASTRPKARADVSSLMAGKANPSVPPGRAGPSAAAVNPARAGVAGREPARPAGADGLVLLRDAVAASMTVPYRGVQVVSWSGPADTTTTVVEVTHEPGLGTLLRTADAGAGPTGESFIPDGRGGQPGEVLGVTEDALDLLAVNYRVVPAGIGSACGRRAAIVEARRADGSLAARFWLDKATKIPLRRELYDGRSQMINVNAFIQLDLSRSAHPIRIPSADAASRPWAVLTAADLARLRVSGWPLPGRLPGGLVLFSARQVTTGEGTVFQLGYSDGLSGLSLFVQHGVLQPLHTGWREVKVAGWPVYTRESIGQGLTWSSRGYVLTLIADAPAGTIKAAVRALPHDTGQGFLARLQHGFGRLVSWVDPFR